MMTTTPFPKASAPRTAANAIVLAAATEKRPTAAHAAKSARAARAAKERSASMPNAAPSAAPFKRNFAPRTIANAARAAPPRRLSTSAVETRAAKSRTPPPIATSDVRRASSDEIAAAPSASSAASAPARIAFEAPTTAEAAAFNARTIAEPRARRASAMNATTARDAVRIPESAVSMAETKTSTPTAPNDAAVASAAAMVDATDRKTAPSSGRGSRPDAAPASATPMRRGNEKNGFEADLAAAEARRGGARVRGVAARGETSAGSALDETRRCARGVSSRAGAERRARFGRAYASSSSSSPGTSADAPRRVKEGGTSADPTAPTARAATTIPDAPVSSIPPTRSSTSINASTTATRPSAIPDASAENEPRATLTMRETADTTKDLVARAAGPVAPATARATADAVS